MNTIKRRVTLCTVLAGAALLGSCDRSPTVPPPARGASGTGSPTAPARSVSSTTTAGATRITFEGIADDAPIGVIAGAPGSGAPVVTFGGAWRGLVDADAGGTGDFANEPSPSTIAHVSEVETTSISWDVGVRRVEFRYVSATGPFVVTGHDKDGNVVASETGAVQAVSTPAKPCAGDPGGTLCNWGTVVLVSESGSLRSLQFIGPFPELFGIDDLTLTVPTHNVSVTVVSAAGRCDVTVTARAIQNSDRYLERAGSDCVATFTLPANRSYVFSVHNAVIETPDDHAVWPDVDGVATDPSLPAQLGAVCLEVKDASGAFQSCDSRRRVPGEYYGAIDAASLLTSNRSLRLAFLEAGRTVTCGGEFGAGTVVYTVIPLNAAQLPAAWQPFRNPPALSVTADNPFDADGCRSEGLPEGVIAAMESRDADGDKAYALVAPTDTHAELIPGPGLGANEVNYLLDPWGDNPQGKDDGGMVLFGLERGTDVFSLQVHTRAIQERGTAQFHFELTDIRDASGALIGGGSLQVKVICSKQQGTCKLSEVLPSADKARVLSVGGALDPVTGNGHAGLRLDFTGAHSARLRLNVGVGDYLDHLPDTGTVRWTRGGGSGSWEPM